MTDKQPATFTLLALAALLTGCVVDFPLPDIPRPRPDRPAPEPIEEESSSGCGEESSSSAPDGEDCSATDECLAACADPCAMDCMVGCLAISPDCVGTACWVENQCEVCP